MSRERWRRGDFDAQERKSFDWERPALERGLSREQAYALYKQAREQAKTSSRRAVYIYKDLLDRAQPEEYHPTPGKVTRTMLLQAGLNPWRKRPDRISSYTGQPIAPGKVVLTSYLQPKVPVQVGEYLHGGEQVDALHPLDEAWTLVQSVLAKPGPDPVGETQPHHDDVLRVQELTPLPDAVRLPMEQAFGHHFDDVLIHHDSPEVSGQTQALTRGREIHFAPGAFAPGTEQGDRILAHELAHVVQQSTPQVGGPEKPSVAALEADAHQAALDVLAGRSAAVHLRAPVGLALAYSDAHEHHPADDAREQHSAYRAEHDADAANHPAQPLPSRADPNALGAGGAPRTARESERPPAEERAAAPRHGREPATQSVQIAQPPATAPISAGEADVLLREAPDTLSAEAQGRLASISTDIKAAASATTELPTAQESTAAARAAVEEPQAEQDAHAQAGVVAAVDDRPPPSPEIEAACTRIRQVIREKRPPDEKSLVNARPREMAAEAGRAMNVGIEERAASVQDGYADMESAPPGQPGREPVPVELPPAEVNVPDVNAGAGVPDELTADDVSLEADVKAQTQRIEEAGMTTEPAQLVQDGPIAEARAGLGDLEAAAAHNPQQVLAKQAAAIATAASDMQALQQAAEQALALTRAGTVQNLGTRSNEIIDSEEAQRARAGAEMQAEFQRARQEVDRLLAPLGNTALARWNAGVEQLSTEFEQSLAHVKQSIEERYETEDDGLPFDEIGATLTRWGDEAFGLPLWVVLEYDRAEETFATGCTDLIREISRDVNAVIESCQGIIEQARQNIDKIAATLPDELKAWAQDEAARLGTELDALESQVTETRQSLNQDLINRSNAAVQEVRERVHELREQAKGLIGRIGDAIAAFLKDPGRAIVNGLLRIVGISPASFWSLVDQLGAVVDGIAADPMGFANNLMAGIGQGFEQFFGNFPAHLGQSLFSWLFSRLGEAGVRMPMNFSVPSIVSLVLEILGITWDRIRGLLAKHIGEDNVAQIERAYEIITTFIAQGPLGLVELLREQLDPQMVVEMIREAALRYLMESLVTRVATRILMMLNPAGAILQAIEAIYRVLKWVYENAARIFTLIEAVVQGAANVLAGNTSGLATLVEGALVRLMVPVIDFLADYLGLGGIPEAIRDLILGLQQRIERILDRVIGFIAERARALLGLGTRPSQVGEDGEDVRIVKPFTMDEEGHTLTVTLMHGEVDIQMASTPGELMAKVRRHIKLVEERLRETRDEEQQQKQNSLREDLEHFKQRFSRLIEETDERGSEDEIRALADEIANALVALGRKHSIDDLGSLQSLEMPENRHDRTIYRMLVELAQEIIHDREQAAEQPTEANQDVLQNFNRAMSVTQGKYARACAATEHPHNIFSACRRKFFVDHQNNYIFPDSLIGNQHATLNGRVYAYSQRSLNELSELSSDRWRNQLVNRFSYRNYDRISPATLRAIANAFANGEPWNENDLTMFLAALIAEADRNKVAHVTNLLVMGAQGAGTNSAFPRMPMATGGSNTPDKPRDPNLREVSDSLPPAEVTDREVRLAKDRFLVQEKLALADAIDQFGYDMNKHILKQIMYNIFS